MKQKKKVRLPRRRLTVTLILGWCDDHFRRFRNFPTIRSGPIRSMDAPLTMNWHKIDIALRKGWFGLPGGSSLTRLLEKHRGLRNKCNLTRLTDDLILAWADHHHDHTGKWPKERSGPVLLAKGEFWVNINAALRQGLRGLKGKRTLPRLLAKARNVRNKADVPDLSIRKILKMADAHHHATGHWPKVYDGPVIGFPGETWQAINSSLNKGIRGLPGGSSLAQVLRLHRSLETNR